MPLPSEVLAAILTDLSGIAAICPPTAALEQHLPKPGSSTSMVISWPALNEDPDANRPGMAQTGTDLGATFVFNFLCGFRDQSQGPQGVVLAPGALAAYDTGPKLRALFYGPCMTRQVENLYSIVVGRVGQNPPGPTGQMQTYGGQFEIIVRFQDDSHIRAYSPQSGGQTGQRP